MSIRKKPVPTTQTTKLTHQRSFALSVAERKAIVANIAKIAPGGAVKSRSVLIEIINETLGSSAVEDASVFLDAIPDDLYERPSGVPLDRLERVFEALKRRHVTITTDPNYEAYEAFIAMGGRPDRTGAVSAEGLLRAAEDVGVESDATRAFIQRIDSDQNGLVEFHEFVQIFTHLNDLRTGCALYEGIGLESSIRDDLFKVSNATLKRIADARGVTHHPVEDEDNDGTKSRKRMPRAAPMTAGLLLEERQQDDLNGGGGGGGVVTENPSTVSAGYNKGMSSSLLLNHLASSTTLRRISTTGRRSTSRLVTNHTVDGALSSSSRVSMTSPQALKSPDSNSHNRARRTHRHRGSVFFKTDNDDEDDDNDDANAGKGGVVVRHADGQLAEKNPFATKLKKMNLQMARGKPPRCVQRAEALLECQLREMEEERQNKAMQRQLSRMKKQLMSNKSDKKAEKKVKAPRPGQLQRDVVESRKQLLESLSQPSKLTQKLIHATSTKTFDITVQLVGVTIHRTVASPERQSLRQNESSILLARRHSRPLVAYSGKLVTEKVDVSHNTVRPIGDPATLSVCVTSIPHLVLTLWAHFSLPPTAKCQLTIHSDVKKDSSFVPLQHVSQLYNGAMLRMEKAEKKDVVEQHIVMPMFQSSLQLSPVSSSRGRKSSTTLTSPNNGRSILATSRSIASPKTPKVVVLAQGEHDAVEEVDGGGVLSPDMSMLSSSPPSSPVPRRASEQWVVN
eukprot:PhM_4_TR17439/c1_g3_i4/m.25381